MSRNNGQNGIDVVAFDGDDTLWHSESHFVDAHERFCALVAPYTDDRGLIDEQVVATERKNLGTYGYGAKAFTLSLIETAIEITGGRITSREINLILDIGKSLLDHPVELLEGVEDVVGELAATGRRLIVVTKGDLFHQEAKLAASGLGDLFTGIEIVSDKKPATFAGIFGRYEVASDRALMAGDSMRSDIFPALEAGAWAAYIPQPLTWSHEQRPAPADHPRFVELPSLAALVNWLDRAEAA